MPRSSSVDTPAIRNLAQARIKEQNLQMQVGRVYQNQFAIRHVGSFEYIQWENIRASSSGLSWKSGSR